MFASFLFYALMHFHWSGTHFHSAQSYRIYSWNTCDASKASISSWCCRPRLSCWPSLLDLALMDLTWSPSCWPSLIISKIYCIHSLLLAIFDGSHSVAHCHDCSETPKEGKKSPPVLLSKILEHEQPRYHIRSEVCHSSLSLPIAISGWFRTPEMTKNVEIFQ